jgi:hypothetical protein
MLMNDIDEILTDRNLKTRIVFICYYDTVWAPKTETIKNPDRFALLLAAITRDYTECVEPKIDESKIKLTEYVYNANVMPKSVNNYLIHAKEWRDICKVPNFVYEYHFWVNQFYEPTGIKFAEIIHNDIKGYHAQGFDGTIEDGSQRSFFPNGFAFYTYGQTLFETYLDFEALKEDYFRHAYGEDYKEVLAFLEKIADCLDHKFIAGERSINEKV